MNKAVHFGAGNIGRGFLGQLYYESGLEMIFVDANPQIVKLINKLREYPLKIVEDTNSRIISIKNISAVDYIDFEQVADEISQAHIISTAVGVKALPHVAKPIALGLIKRWMNQDFTPINIIICENMIDAGKYLKKTIFYEISLNENVRMISRNETLAKMLDETVGFVDTSVGRMVPVLSDEVIKENSLEIWAESYSELPIDKGGLRGNLPAVKNFVPYSPFEYHIKRKLYIHNAGHAILAYLGYIKGYRFIYECIEDKSINHICRFALYESGSALSEEYSIQSGEINEYIADLMKRFRNRALKDTVERVGRAPLRKLGNTDRLVGAANLSLRRGSIPIYLCMGIASALKFSSKDDDEAQTMQKTISDCGPEKILQDICKLKPDDMIFSLILNFYNILGKSDVMF